MPFKLPRSVLVVVYFSAPEGREYLLLRRASRRAGLWQSVTGSLELGETHRQAAVRELAEETGLTAADLIDLRITNEFEIAAEWRVLYEPGVTHNQETCYAAEVSSREVRLDPLEHDDYIWTDYRSALKMLHWSSNKRALEAAESIANRSTAIPPSGPRGEEQVES